MATKFHIKFRNTAPPPIKEIFLKKKKLLHPLANSGEAHLKNHPVYIAYHSELNLQICIYEQKRRICCENSKYLLDENSYGHFCPRRMAANFCHPGFRHNKWQTIIVCVVINWKFLRVYPCKVCFVKLYGWW